MCWGAKNQVRHLVWYGFGANNIVKHVVLWVWCQKHRAIPFGSSLLAASLRTSPFGTMALAFGLALASLALGLQGCGKPRSSLNYKLAPAPAPPATTISGAAPATAAKKPAAVALSSTASIVSTTTTVMTTTVMTTTVMTTTMSTTTMSTTTVSTTTIGRLGSFLVLGDWGWDVTSHGNIYTPRCQRAIATAMDERAKLLGDVQFVVNVGDSFYPKGVLSQNDSQWDAKWRSVYTEHLRSVPWYSVYGNRDYRQDPCACSDDPKLCAQVFGDTNDRRFFYMPDVSFFAEHRAMDLEVVALDMNHLWADQTCMYTGCEAKCRKNLKDRMDKSFELYWHRMEESSARNLVVFSHYPTDYFKGMPAFLGGLRDGSRHRIEYFAGHRHNVDQRTTVPTSPNNNWLVGGGGGWACEDYGNEQGFVVGEVYANNITTNAVLVDAGLCCAGRR